MRVSPLFSPLATLSGLGIAAAFTGGSSACSGSSSHPAKETLTDGQAPTTDSTTAIPEAGRDDAGGPFVQATHAPFPQVPYQGGGVLQAPKVVTITFPNDSNASQFISGGGGAPIMGAGGGIAPMQPAAARGRLAAARTATAARRARARRVTGTTSGRKRISPVVSCT